MLGSGFSFLTGDPGGQGKGLVLEGLGQQNWTQSQGPRHTDLITKRKHKSGAWSQARMRSQIAGPGPGLQ